MVFPASFGDNMMSLNLSPGATLNDFADCGLSAPVLTGEMRNAVPRSMSRTNYPNVVCGELRSVVPFPLSLPVSSEHVVDVLSGRPQNQMMRVDVQRGVIGVSNNQPEWNLAIEQQVGRDMGFHVPSISSDTAIVVIYVPTPQPQHPFGRGKFWHVFLECFTQSSWALYSNRHNVSVPPLSGVMLRTKLLGGCDFVAPFDGASGVDSGSAHTTPYMAVS